MARVIRGTATKRLEAQIPENHTVTLREGHGIGYEKDSFHLFIMLQALHEISYKQLLF